MDGEILDKKLVARIPLARRGDDVALYEVMLILERVLVLEIWPLREIPPGDREQLIAESRTRLLKRLLSRLRRITEPVALTQSIARQVVTQYHRDGLQKQVPIGPESVYLRDHLDRAMDLVQIDVEIASEQAHVAYLVAEGATYARIAKLLGCEPGEVEDILRRATRNSNV